QREDRHQLVDLADRPAGLVAAHAGKHQVEDHDIDWLLGILEVLERGRPVTGEQGRGSLLLEIEFEPLSQRSCVFDDQDPHSSALPGRFTSNTLPFPSSRSRTITVPFSKWTSVRTIYRPRPVPFCVRSSSFPPR